MESAVVEMFSLPQLILGLDVGNGLSSFVVLDDPGGSVQRFFAGEDVLWRVIGKNQYQWWPQMKNLTSGFVTIRKCLARLA